MMEVMRVANEIERLEEEALLKKAFMVRLWKQVRTLKMRFVT